MGSIICTPRIVLRCGGLCDAERRGENSENEWQRPHGGLPFTFSRKHHRPRFCFQLTWDEAADGGEYHEAAGAICAGIRKSAFEAQRTFAAARSWLTLRPTADTASLRFHEILSRFIAQARLHVAESVTALRSPRVAAKKSPAWLWPPVNHLITKNN